MEYIEFLNNIDYNYQFKKKLIININLKTT